MRAAPLLLIILLNSITTGPELFLGGLVFDHRHLEFGFLACAIVFTPGPKIFFSMDTFLTRGKNDGCRFLAGTASANLFLGILTLALLSLLGSSLQHSLQIICWLGIAVIASLGLKQFIDICRLSKKATPKRETVVASSRGTFLKGFGLATLNPKALICMASIIPLYISPECSFKNEFLRFWIVFAFLDISALLVYSCLLNKIYSVLSVQTRKLTAGVCYIIAAALLAIKIG